MNHAPLQLKEGSNNKGEIIVNGHKDICTGVARIFPSGTTGVGR